VDKPTDPYRVFSDELLNLKHSGFGALTHPEIDRWIAQTLLVSRLNSLYPKRLRTLRDNCLSTYLDLFDAGKRLLPDLVRDFAELPIVTSIGLVETHAAVLIDSWKNLDLAATQHEVAGELRNRVMLWAQRQNLVAGWFLDVVIKMLMVWRLAPETAGRPLFFKTGGMSIGSDRRLGDVSLELRRIIYQLAPAKDKFAVPAYNPAMQTRQEHSNEVMNLLRQHQLELEDRFKAAGFILSRPRRARKRRVWEDIDWFLHYQVGGRSVREIASGVKDAGSISEVAVNKTLAGLAALLQMPLHRRLPSEET
jgi:hypothetical protein